MSTSLITHLRPGVLGSSIPSTRNSDGAWLFKQPPTIGGLIVDERRGLGDERPELGGQYHTLNGTNQYEYFDLQVPVSAYPFSLFGWAKKTGTVNKALMSISNPASAVQFINIGGDNGDLVWVGRSNTTEFSNTQAVPLISGWFSFVFVFLNATTVEVYRNGLLIHTFSGLSAMTPGTGFTRLALGVYRSLSAGSHWDGSLANCGLIRSALTLSDAQFFHANKYIEGAEVFTKLANNSTTVATNDGAVHVPKRNLAINTEAPNTYTTSANCPLTNTTAIGGFTLGEFTPNIGVSSDSVNGVVIPVVRRNGTAVTVSFVCRPASGISQYRTVRNNSATETISIVWNFSTETTNVITGAVTTNIQNLGNGLFRCSFSFTNSVAGADLAQSIGYTFCPLNAAGSGESFLFGAFQPEVGTLSAYQRIMPDTQLPPLEGVIVNGTAGMLVTSNDAPRGWNDEVGYSPRANLLTNSNGSGWLNIGSAGTITANAISGPTTDSPLAHKFSSAAGAQFTYRKMATPEVIHATGATMSAGVFLKAGELSQVLIDISDRMATVNLDTGTITISSATSATIEFIGNGWYYCTVTGIRTSNSPAFIDIGSLSGISAGQGFYAVGAQIWNGTPKTPQRIGADPGTNALFPALLSDPTKSAALDTLEFTGQAPRNLQAQDAPCLQLNGTNQNVLMDLNTIAGPELPTNGGFSNGATGWSLGAGWSVSGGKLIATVAAAGTSTHQFTLPLDKSFVWSINVESITGTLRVLCGTNGSHVNITTPGLYEFVLNNFGVTQPTRLNLFVPSGTLTATIDNVSVRELTSPLVEKLGTERVTNGGFDSTADWTETTSWTISAGNANYDGSNANTNLVQALSTPLVAGGLYRIEVTGQRITAGNGFSVVFTGGGSGATVSFGGAAFSGSLVAFVTTTHPNTGIQIAAGGVTNPFSINSISIKQVAQIDSEGTSILRYLQDGTGFTGTSGTVWNVRFDGVTRFPCSESSGANIYDIVENVACGITNPASNWSTQDSYFYGLHYGYTLSGSVQIPASATNPGFDANGGTNPLTHKAGAWNNLASCEIVAAQPDSVWTFGRDIPGVDGFDPWDAATDGVGGLGDITAKLRQPKKIGKLKLPKV